MQDNKKLLFKYAGFAIQLLVALGIAVYTGLWIDKKAKLSNPLWVWLLPLVLLVLMIVKVIKDTSKK